MEIGLLKKAAASLVAFWVKNGVINQSETDAYIYGMELLFSTSINISIMFIVSVIARDTWLFIPYLASFIPLRLSAGGYHAKHHYSCILFNTIVYSMSIASMKLFPAQSLVVFCLLESIVSCITTFLFAPVPAKNKPLSDEEYRRGKMLSRVLAMTILVATILLYISGKKASIEWIMMCFGQSSATLLLLIEVFPIWGSFQ